jgi:hypothetical protein
MIIILTNISDTTDKQDIEGFIRPFVNNGRIENIAIMAQKDIKTHDLQYHTLVTIMPDSVAKEAVKKIKWTEIKLKGRDVAIREYQSRSCQNDPRSRKEQAGRLNDQRQSDRRRQYSGIFPISGGMGNKAASVSYPFGELSNEKQS